MHVRIIRRAYDSCDVTSPRMTSPKWVMTHVRTCTCMPRASVYIDYNLWYVMLACHSVYILLAYIYHTAFIYVTWGYFNLSFLLHCIAVIHLSPLIGSAIIHLTDIVIHTILLSYTQLCNDISNHGLQYNVRRFTLDVLYTLAWFIAWPWNIFYALYPGCAIHPSMIIPWIWYILYRAASTFTLYHLIIYYTLDMLYTLACIIIWYSISECVLICHSIPVWYTQPSVIANHES